MSVTKKIYKEVKSGFNQEVEIAGVKTTPKNIALRTVVYLITLSWISFYPLYLLTIYMHVEGFFSYDIFVNGIFGVNAFFVFLFVMLVLAGLYCWGFIPALKATQYYAVNRWLKSLVLIVFVLASGLIHYFLVIGGMEAKNYLVLFWVSGAGLLVSLSITSYLDKPFSKVINNWLGPMLFIAISATVPLLSKEAVSEAVKVGLRGFGVGGDINVSVKHIFTDKELISGKLLLLTPNYVYIKGEEGGEKEKGEEGSEKKNKGYKSISRNNESYIEVNNPLLVE